MCWDRMELQSQGGIVHLKLTFYFFKFFLYIYKPVPTYNIIYKQKCQHTGNSIERKIYKLTHKPTNNFDTVCRTLYNPNTLS